MTTKKSLLKSPKLVAKAGGKKDKKGEKEIKSGDGMAGGEATGSGSDEKVTVVFLVSTNASVVRSVSRLHKRL